MISRGHARWEKVLGFYTAGWAIDGQADVGNRWGGLPVIGGGCFRPVVLDASKSTNLSVLAAIIANYALREHDPAFPLGRCEAICHVQCYLVQNPCQNVTINSNGACGERLFEYCRFLRGLFDRGTKCMDEPIGAIAVEEVGG